MEFNELIYERRSTRSFKDEPVTAEQIEKMLDAAIHAPNACNFQSWHFYVVKSESARAKIGGMCGRWGLGASVVFVVCTDAAQLEARFGERGRDLFAVQDTAAAIENLLLCAADIGLGGCWVGAFDEAACREALDIPQGRRPVAIIPVGVPAEKPAMRARVDLSDVVTVI